MIFFKKTHRETFGRLFPALYYFGSIGTVLLTKCKLFQNCCSWGKKVHFEVIFTIFTVFKIFIKIDSENFLNISYCYQNMTHHQDFFGSFPDNLQSRSIQFTEWIFILSSSKTYKADWDILTNLVLSNLSLKNNKNSLNKMEVLLFNCS